MARADVPQSEISVLYVYDFEDWAIHNVGRLWLGENPGISTTFVGIEDLTRELVDAHQIIWFGYLQLCVRACAEGVLQASDLARCAVSVHDPKELFPERSDWPQLGITPRPLYSRAAWERWLGFTLLPSLHVVVTSLEMEAVLAARAIATTLIPTASLVPARSVSDLATEKCDAISVFQPMPRKDQPLMERVAAALARVSATRLTMKVGRVVLDLPDYVALLDEHEVYVCTSYQEGGPLPAMDAMARGAVVVSTPVGQLQELVVDGQTGFICRTEDEFVGRIRALADNLPQLHEMRAASLGRLAAERSPARLKRTAHGLVQAVLAGTNQAQARAGWSSRLAVIGCRVIPHVLTALLAGPKMLWRAIRPSASLE